MIRYIINNKKGNEIGNNWESRQRLFPEILQLTSHHRSDFQQKCKIAKLKNGWIDVEDLDVMPFYSHTDLDSYEQYRNIVSGVPGSDGYREVRAE